MTQENSDRKKPGEAVRATEEELSRLNRVLQTLYQCNHALVHATDEHELFESVCQILVEAGGLRLAWVGQCEDDAEKTVRPVAKAGYGLDYLESARISWGEETERGWGPTGFALRTGKPYWVKDIRTEPTLAPWRTEAIARGDASCVALPLIADGKRLGNLSLYAGEPNAFNESTIEQYSELANNLAYGVTALRTREERERAEEALRESEQRLQDIVDNTTEVLRRSLDALARDKRLQSFVGQIPLVLTEQLEGHSSTLWLIDVQQRRAYLHSVCRDGRVVLAEDSDHPNAHEPRDWSSDDPGWLALQMKRPLVYHEPVNDPQLYYTPAQRAHFSALGIRAVVSIPLIFGEELIGLVSIRIAGNRQVDEADLEFAQSLAQQATLALELARLAEQAKQTALAIEREKAARERAAELAKAKGARQSAVLEERNKMAGEIHDSLAQFFTGILLQLGAAKKVIKKGGNNSLSYVERASELAQFGLAEARRSAFSLQPTIIEELGLVQALQKLVERSNIKGKLRCNFHSTGVPEESLPTSVQEALLRIAQEAMSNALRHALPTVINVSLCCDPSKLVLEVADNGSGIANPEAACREGFGLSNMQARAKNLGAQLDVRTSAGRGTSIVVRMPTNS
jgi:signal transduction histidine kinase